MPMILYSPELASILATQLSEDEPSLIDSDLMIKLHQLDTLLKKKDVGEPYQHIKSLPTLLRSPCFASHLNNIKHFGKDYFIKLAHVINAKGNDSVSAKWVFDLCEYTLVYHPEISIQLETVQYHDLERVTGNSGPSRPFHKAEQIYHEIIKFWLESRKQQAAGMACSSSHHADDTIVDFNEFIKLFSTFYQKYIDILKESPRLLAAAAMRFLFRYGEARFDAFVGWHQQKNWHQLVTMERLTAFGHILEHYKNASDVEIRKILISEHACLLVNHLFQQGKRSEIQSLLDCPDSYVKVKEAVLVKERTSSTAVFSNVLDILFHMPKELDFSEKELLEHLSLSSYAGDWRNRDIGITVKIAKQLTEKVNEPEWILLCIQKHCKTRYHYLALKAMVLLGFDKTLINIVLHADGNRNLSEQYAFLILGLKHRQKFAENNENPAEILSQLLLPGERRRALSEIKAFQASKNKNFKQLGLALDLLIKSNNQEKRKPSYYQSIDECLAKKYNFSCSEAIKPKNTPELGLTLQDIYNYYKKNQQFNALETGAFDTRPVWVDKLQRWAKKNKIQITFSEQVSDAQLAQTWQALMFMENTVIARQCCQQLLKDTVDARFWETVFAGLYSQGHSLDRPLALHHDFSFDTIWNKIEDDQAVCGFQKKAVGCFNQLKQLHVSENILLDYVALKEEQKKRIFKVVDHIEQSMKDIEQYLEYRVEMKDSVGEAKSSFIRNMVQISLSHLKTVSKPQNENELTLQFDNARTAFLQHEAIHPSLGLRDFLRFFCHAVSALLLFTPLIINYAITGHFGFFSGSGAESQIGVLQENVETTLQAVF